MSMLREGPMAHRNRPSPATTATTEPPGSRSGVEPHRAPRGRSWRAAALVGSLGLTLILVPGTASAAEPVAEPVTEWHVPVLMYHRVAPDSDLRSSIVDLVVRPRTFAGHMRILHEHGWRTITAEALAAAMRARVAVPPRTVVLTFDDGTQDVYTNAWPIMQRHGYVGTFYLITSRTYRHNRPRSYSMSQLQAMDLAAAGNDIGNHTRDHVCLAGTSDATARQQIVGGARDITAIGSLEPRTLAWPKGCHDATSERAARATGTYLAFTTVPGCRETVSDRLVTPRLRVSRSTTPKELLSMVSRCG